MDRTMLRGPLDSSQPFVFSHERHREAMLDSWKEVHDMGLIQYACHHACAYGSKRRKSTMLAFTFHLFAEVSARCDNKHEHEPWGLLADGTFATSAEVRYPRRLCQVVASVVGRMLLEAKVNFKGVDALSTFQLTESQQQQLQAGKQSRRSAGLWTPGYRYIVQVTGPAHLVPQGGTCDAILSQDWYISGLLRCEPHLRCIPKGSKLLHCYFAAGGRCSNASQTVAADITVLRSTDIQNSDDATFFASVGVRWAPLGFVREAVNRGHPKGVAAALPKALKQAVDKHVTSDAALISKARLQWAQKWTARAAQLRADEAHLKSTLDKEVAKNVANKRILLFEEILAEMEYEDTSVSSILREGVPLVGDVQRSHVFPAQFKPAVMSVQCLRSMTPAINALVTSQTACSAEDELAGDLWTACLEEVEKGWLTPPVQAALLPKTTHASRRFPLLQKNKLRMIDDFSQSQVNSTTSVFEKPVMFAVDCVASLLVTWASDARGAWCEGDLLGKSYDLKSAYKQLAVDPASREWAFLSVWDPCKRHVALFRSLVAPFGVQSVHCFLRLSVALWAIGCRMLFLLWTVFYDDYLSFSPSLLAASADQAATLIFELTGWVFAKDGTKSTTFAKEVSGLGVAILLADLKVGNAYLANTASRKDEIVAEINCILESGKLLPTKALQLHGRMHFAMGQLYGRTGKAAVRLLSKHAHGGTGVSVDKQLRAALAELLLLIQNGAPRILNPASGTTWYIFTDASQGGAEDGNSIGLGGVLVCPLGRYKEHFSE